MLVQARLRDASSLLSAVESVLQQHSEALQPALSEKQEEAIGLQQQLQQLIREKQFLERENEGLVSFTRGLAAFMYLSSWFCFSAVALSSALWHLKFVTFLNL